MKLVEGMNEQRLLYFVKMEKIATSTVSSCCLQMIDLEKGEKTISFLCFSRETFRTASLSFLTLVVLSWLYSKPVLQCIKWTWGRVRWSTLKTKPFSALPTSMNKKQSQESTSTNNGHFTLNLLLVLFSFCYGGIITKLWRWFMVTLNDVLYTGVSMSGLYGQCTA